MSELDLDMLIQTKLAAAQAIADILDSTHSCWKQSCLICKALDDFRSIMNKKQERATETQPEHACGKQPGPCEIYCKPEPVKAHEFTWADPKSFACSAPHDYTEGSCINLPEEHLCATCGKPWSDEGHLALCKELDEERNICGGLMPCGAHSNGRVK